LQAPENGLDPLRNLGRLAGPDACDGRVRREFHELSAERGNNPKSRISRDTTLPQVQEGINTVVPAQFSGSR